MNGSELPVVAYVDLCWARLQSSRGLFVRRCFHSPEIDSTWTTVMVRPFELDWDTEGRTAGVRVRVRP